MKVLRKDLIILSNNENDPTITIKDPTTGKEFTFKDKEAFLVDAMTKHFNEIVLLTKLNARFQSKESKEIIDNLIQLLTKNELMSDVGTQSPAPAVGDNLNQQPKELHDFAKTNGATNLLNHWSLFNPQKILDLLTLIFSPFRHLHLLIYPVFLVSIYAIFINFHLYQKELLTISSTFSLATTLLFTLLTVNLAVQLFKGCIARYFNLPTPSFGVMLAKGVIPRFTVHVGITDETPRKAKLFIVASSIITRMFLIITGTLVWLLTQATGNSLALLGAALIMYSMISLFFVINPLVNSDGYRLITLYYDLPDVRKMAVRSIRNIFLPTPDVVKKHTTDRMALKIYGLASLLFIILLISFIGYTAASWLETNYHGFGVFLFLLLTTYILLRARYLTKARKVLQAGGTLKSDISEMKSERPPSMAMDNANAGNKSSLKSKVKKVRWVRCCLISAFLVAMFLPYNYEVGGDTVIAPVLHQEIFFETKGIVGQVFFDGGEWVKKGTVIAEMDNYRQKRDVDTTTSLLKKKKEEINILLTTPLPEEIELIEQQIKTLRFRLSYSQKEFDRKESIYKQKVISLSEYLAAKENLDVTKQDLAEKEAVLKLTENQVNVHTIESLKFDMDVLQRELLFFEDQLDRTKLRMPSDGRIITMDLKNRENLYLDDGMPFAEIEDTTTVKLEILIPETDASFVAVGSPLNFKPKLDPTKKIVGRVSSIYPATENTEYGTALKVVALIPNSDNFLKTGMTGYAKIAGKEMLVIEAYTRALVRLIQIELWSWIP